MNSEHWKTIHGWFDFANIYNDWAKNIKDGDIIIELGTWLGKSTCYLAQKLKDSGKKVKFYACDLFIRPNEEPFVAGCPDKDFYKIFLSNLKMQGVDDFVLPVILDSIEFAKQFDDGSVSFLFVDDSHHPSHVYRELHAWYPKLKIDGVFAGHDALYIRDEALQNFMKDKDLTYVVDGNSWITRRK